VVGDQRRLELDGAFARRGLLEGNRAIVQNEIGKRAQVLLAALVLNRVSGILQNWNVASML